MSNLISAVAWVKRGVAVRHPQKYVLDDQELQRVSALARVELEDIQAACFANGDVADDEGGQDDKDDSVMEIDSGAPSKNDPDDLSKYNLDTYDDEPQSSALGPLSNIKGLTYYKDNSEDPYITLKEEDNTEREDLEIYPTDNLLVTAKTEDDISQLDIYVYDESEENLYVHHDLMLPNFPLCLEWLDLPPATGSSAPPAFTNPATPGFGNFIAVGTLDPEIEIWSLDVVDAMYPTSILGRPDETKAHIPTPLGTGKKKRKKTKQRSTEKRYHTDAVLGLSWNKTQRNLLASCSADRTVKLWDLTRDPTAIGEGSGAIKSFEVHRDKVQAVQWNEKEPSVLLTGSYDRTVRTFDSRAPEAGVGAVLGSDVEALRWDPWEPHGFYVSLENGFVLNFDARTLPSSLDQPSPARFTLSAHDGAASSIDVNPHFKGCIVTGGTDKMVKVWNIIDDDDLGKRNVSLVLSRDLGVGKVFSTTWSPDDPLTLAAAGSKARLQLWDIGINFGVRKTFAEKLHNAGKVLKEKTPGENSGVVGVEPDVEESEDEE